MSTLGSSHLPNSTLLYLTFQVQLINDNEENIKSGFNGDQFDDQVIDESIHIHQVRNIEITPSKNKTSNNSINTVSLYAYK